MQCTLVLAKEFYHDWTYRSRWDPFVDRDTRKEMQRQIEDDRRTFDRYFRPNHDFRKLIARDIDAITSFLYDHLNVVAWDLPKDNAGIERVLKQAVVDGRLVPIVNRDWGGYQRTFRPAPAPERWPASVSALAARIEPYGGGLSASMGGSQSLGPAEKVASSADDGDSGSGFDWLGVAEAVAWAALGSRGDDLNEGGDGLLTRRLADDESATPLGDAQPLEYSEDLPSGDAFEIAKTPNAGEPGTWYTNPGSGQMRLYGADGNPAVDLDFDHDHGQGIPHAHNWSIDPLSGNRVRGPGLPMSVWP
ncbi:hypothetical protein BamMEX5DRAFT_2346 [Burkholderia ambifaria MEX-5]|uniref:Bacterial toxin 24 domain-containing protein n=1 Tax=Burkholderia ambifaria MEX-5 TaxID=396597 RepID=B1T3I0_9BURK|nr:hypothetical protein BamMEX5DRAFT_2346 [Burkholderia ambifaria MEX-5]